MARVFIGVDPHKLSATIEVVDDRETVLATGRFTTDKAGYAAMRRHVAAFPERVWAVEGSNGAGRPLAQRLLADGEHGGGRAGEAVGPGPAVRHRAQPQDRCPRRARGGGRRGANPRPAGAVLRQRARGVADAGRPPRGAHPGQGPDRQPAAAAAVRADPGQGQEEHHRRSGQDDPRRRAPPGPGRQDPPPARGRATRRAGRDRQEDHRLHQGAQGDGPGPRLHADGPDRRRARGGRADPGRRRRRRPVR